MSKSGRQCPPPHPPEFPPLMNQRFVDSYDFVQDCRDGTTGLHCEECEEGYVGDATRGTPNDCQLCACPEAVNGRK